MGCFCMVLPPEIVMALEAPVGKSRENTGTGQTQLSGGKHQRENPPLLAKLCCGVSRAGDALDHQ